VKEIGYWMVVGRDERIGRRQGVLPKNVHACERLGDGTPRIVQDEAMDEILQTYARNEEYCHGLEDMVRCGQALA